MAAGAFKVDLTVNSKTYRVFNLSFSIHQDVDKTGRPSGEVRGGTIQVEIEASDKTDIFAWSIDDFKMYNGSFKFYKKDDNAQLKSLDFTDGYCVGFTETFSNLGDQPASIHFVISARQISLGGVVFTNEWENLN